MKRVLKFKKYQAHILNVPALEKEFFIEFGEIDTKQNFCAGKGHKRQLNQNYCTMRFSTAHP